MLTFHASSVLILCPNSKMIAHIRKLCSRKMPSYGIGSLFFDWLIIQGLSWCLNNTDLNKIKLKSILNKKHGHTYRHYTVFWLFTLLDNLRKTLI